MSYSPEKTDLGRLVNFALLLMALCLACLLLVMRSQFNSDKQLYALARNSIDPKVALSNGNPTVIEFYAEWCEACREMAPAINKLEELNKGKLDFVLLNVDNDLWQDLIEEYKVYGIPQLNFFDSDGELMGKAVGVRKLAELQEVVDALLTNQDFPSLSGKTVTTALDDTKLELGQSQTISPLSHGLS